jgi:hypothetical protein
MRIRFFCFHPAPSVLVATSNNEANLHRSVCYLYASACGHICVGRNKDPGTWCRFDELLLRMHSRCQRKSARLNDSCHSGQKLLLAPRLHPMPCCMQRDPRSERQLARSLNWLHLVARCQTLLCSAWIKSGFLRRR